MTLTSTIQEIGITTLAELIKNLAWFILIIWGVKVLSKEIGKGVKQVPVWLEQYDKTIMKRRTIDRALEGFNR